MPLENALIRPTDRIIVALDVDNFDAAGELVHSLNGKVGAFKVGLELIHREGVSVFERLRQAGADRIFYDGKLHDIPNTVAGAMRSIARYGLWMTNLHASGGSRMIAAGAEALKLTSGELGLAAPILLGVTVLTSLSPVELRDEVGVLRSPEEQVVHLANMTQQSGADGVVASPLEIEAIRRACGPGFIIVTPGVRPAGSDAGDQRRVMTPGEAVQRGADYLVIGRPITASTDPVSAAARIADEIASIA